jgi:hypothetical protein
MRANEMTQIRQLSQDFHFGARFPKSLSPVANYSFLESLFILAVPCVDFKDNWSLHF